MIEAGSDDEHVATKTVVKIALRDAAAIGNLTGGLIGLKAGYHRITAYMFQCKGGEALGISVTEASLPKQAILAAMLFHEEAAGD